jgi:hypothetical protein
MILDDFKLYKNVSFNHMSFQKNNNNILFLYKYVEGIILESFGINVAEMVLWGLFRPNYQKVLLKLLMKYPNN